MANGRIQMFQFPKVVIPVILSYLSLILFSQFGFQSSFAQGSANYTTYQNLDMGIRLSYPSLWFKAGQYSNTIDKDCSDLCEQSWEVNNTQEILAIDKYDPSGQTISQSCKCDSLIQFVKYMYKKNQNDAGADFTFINDNQTIVGKKYPAWQYEYSHSIGKNLDILTKVNNTYYAILYLTLGNGSYGKHLPEVKEVIDSIEFLPIQKPVARIPSFMNANDTKGSSLIKNESAASNTLHISYLETYDNPLLGFKFQYPLEWKRVMTEGLAGVGFSLSKLNNTEPNTYDTFGFMTLDVPETKTLKQYLRDLNLILKINSSTLKLVEAKLSGYPALNATWIEKNDKVEMIYTILDKTAYSSLYKADSKTYDKNLKEVNKIINSFQITK
jgi:hypothetical protein